MIQKNLFVFLFVLVASNSWAQDATVGDTTVGDATKVPNVVKGPNVQLTLCSEKDPLKCAKWLNKSELAPFPGALLTPELAISLGSKASICESIKQAEIEKLSEEYQLKLKMEQELREMQKRSYQNQLNLANKRLAENHTTPWYEHPMFVSSVTAVVAILVFTGTAELYKEIK